MKDTQATATKDRMTRSRYAELKQMLDARRREIQAEVQGKMRDVREEGTWGGKLNEVLDAVESSEADIQEDIEFALIQMKSETLNKINDALVAPRARQLRHTVSIAERKSRKSACARCPSPSAARTARKRGRSPSSGSGSWRRGAARARCSSTCKHPAFSDRAPPVAEPISPHRRFPQFSVRSGLPGPEMRSR